MSKVTVIGLGAMGATLTRLLLRNGCHVTVWNRTIANAEFPTFASSSNEQWQQVTEMKKKRLR